MSAPVCTLGRYTLFEEIAAGGMAAVHFGRQLGSVGFSRTVAIKRLHAQFAKNPDFVDMFLDEARLAARIRHPNVVPTLDVVSEAGELFLVMEYVEGESLSKLHRAEQERGKRIDPRIAVSLTVNLLDGLQAAHEARSESGEPLEIIHRDVSPQNILVGADGVARVLDFGVAKANGRLQVTREGQLKGKLAYMAPEQLEARPFDRRVDIFAAGVVLWELLAGRKLFDGASEAVVFGQILHLAVEPPSQHTPGLPPALDKVVMRALERAPGDRYSSAHEMAAALEQALPLASPREVATWMRGLASAVLQQRADCISRIESSTGLAAQSASLSAGAARGGAQAAGVSDDLPTQVKAPPSQRERALASTPAPTPAAPASEPARPRESAPSLPRAPGNAPSSRAAPPDIDPIAVLLHGPSGRPAPPRPATVVRSPRKEEQQGMHVVRWLLLLSLAGLILAGLTPSGREGFLALASDLARFLPSGSAPAPAPQPGR